MADTEAKWYVVHTYSGYENKVAKTIERTVENYHLEDRFFGTMIGGGLVLDGKVRQGSHFSAGDISVSDNYITKDHGDHVEINIGASTPKGHVSYDLYFDSNGHLTGYKPHN